jgi:hypothetical protein
MRVERLSKMAPQHMRAEFSIRWPLWPPLVRHKLETEGCAFTRSHREFFRTTPWEERYRPTTPRCLEVLGLERGADREAFGRAKRGANETWIIPDRGYLSE